MGNIKTCTFSNCNLPVNSPHDDTFCFGHAPLENKGMDNETFDQNLRKEKIYKNDFNFEGFIFSSCFTFPSERDVGGNEIILNSCKFCGAKTTNVEGENIYLSIDFNSLRFNTAIKIENSEIINSTRFEFANYNHPLTIQKVDFGGKVFAKKVSCKEDLIINNCTFNGDVNIPDATFEKQVFINKNNFIKNVTFNRSKFRSNVNFDGTIFCEAFNFGEVKELKGDTSFQNINFQGNTYFNDCVFSEFAKFHKSTFHSNVSFKRTTFNSKLFLTKVVAETINLSGTTIEGDFKARDSDFTNFDLSDSKCAGLVEFQDSSFEGENKFDRTIFLKAVDFNRVAFLGIPESRGISFHFTEFNDHVVLDSNQIGTKIIFDNITQGGKTTFYFTKPKFNDVGICIFKNIQFEPFTSYFEYINHVSLKPLLIFRYCNLKDVFFSNNNLSLFSFYKSVFDEARFILPKWNDNREKVWGFPYRRKNIIFEDHHFNQIIRKNSKSDILKVPDLLLEDLDNLGEIANLYRRFKTALDKSKDYEQAGWFYFNELEMKRKGYERERKLGSKFKYVIYSIYKTFAGYGEKPFWSFVWFLVFTFLFSILNLFGGFSYKDKIINYDLAINQIGFTDFNLHWINDWLLSVFYSFLRIIPFNYSPFAKNDFIPIGIDSIFLSFVNSITLLIFATLIGIGLKRIFRRF